MLSTIRTVMVALLGVCSAGAFAQGSTDGPSGAPTANTRFEGKSIAQGKFRSQVMALARQYAQLRTNCSGPIESMATEIVAVPKKPTFANGLPVSGEVIEKWVASLCGKNQPMYVTYSFTPEGKANYAVSGEPQKEGFLESLPSAK
jgi:hypothetical protein